MFNLPLLPNYCKAKTRYARRYGATFTYQWKKLPVLGKDVSFNVDYFITEFSNQVVINLENPREIVFNNLEGLSYSNALQTDINFSPFENIEMKVAYLDAV